MQTVASRRLQAGAIVSNGAKEYKLSLNIRNSITFVVNNVVNNGILSFFSKISSTKRTQTIKNTTSSHLFFMLLDVIQVD